MPQYLRAYAERAADTWKPGDPIRFVASTENVARDGMVIAADAWQLENFRKSPTITFAHRYDIPPIGKAVDIGVRDNQLIADIVFDSENDEFAAMIEKKIRAGVLSASSVGFDILQIEPANAQGSAPRVTKTDLLEIAIVPVPADPDALAARQKRALGDFGRDLLKLIEPEQQATADGVTVVTVDTQTFTNKDLTVTASGTTEQTPPSARATWEADAAAMVGLYRPFTQRPDAERKEEHARLSRAYAKHGKEAPEFLDAATLEALGPAEIRGLFLSGEPELLPDLFAAMDARAGKALNARNQDRLEQAARLIGEVLESARKDSEQTDEERSFAEIEALRKQLLGD